MSEALLALRHVGVGLGGRLVVEDVSLKFASGAFVAMVGPNGAGKTSLLRALVGLLSYSGEARFRGQNLRGLTAGERARALAYLPQGHAAHWPLPARDIVALGRYPHGVRDPGRLATADAEAIAAAMRLTETEAFADRPVTSLSGGEQARVALARVFAVEAPVILADEPTAALDPRHQIDVMSALAGRAEAGALVIAVTHDLGLAARFADEVVVMQAGRIVAAGPPSETLSERTLREVFGIAAFRAEADGRPVLVPWA